MIFISRIRWQSSLHGPNRVAYFSQLIPFPAMPQHRRQVMEVSDAFRRMLGIIGIARYWRHRVDHCRRLMKYLTIAVCTSMHMDQKATDAAFSRWLSGIVLLSRRLLIQLFHCMGHLFFAKMLKTHAIVISVYDWLRVLIFH